MNIEIEKTVTIKEKVNTDKLAVVLGGSRDIDSTKLTVTYEGVEIAYGHLNNVSNMAHISMYTENEDLEGYLVRVIEEREINFK